MKKLCVLCSSVNNTVDKVNLIKPYSCGLILLD